MSSLHKRPTQVCGSADEISQGPLRTSERFGRPSAAQQKVEGFLAGFRTWSNNLFITKILDSEVVSLPQTMNILQNGKFRMN